MVTIESEHGTPQGTGWYNAGEQFELSIEETVNDDSGSYSFAGWAGTGSGSYTGQERTIVISVAGPITEIANWEQATSLYSYLWVVLILLAIIAALLLLRRKKKQTDNDQKDEANQQ
jgi:hypothetical protein